MLSPQQPIDAFETKHLRADLKGHSVRGGVLAIASQGSQFLMQTVYTVILARLLTPADFGIVAMVTAVTGLASAFADLGLSEATIQRKEISHEQVSTLFWINVAIGMGLMLLTTAMGPVLAWFYGEPRLKNITLLLSFTFLISGLRVQHNALLKRLMRFRAMAARDVFCYALGVPVSITMAFKGAGYWSIVALPLTVNFMQMALSWLMVNWRPGLPHREANVGSMLVFGSNVAGSYIINYIDRNADNFLIGWYWGAGPLGLYSRAYNLLMAPLRQLNAPATAVAVPAFSRIHDDEERYARFYLRTANLMMWTTAPLFGFLAVAAEPIIILVLGHQWRDAVPVFQILAISALGQPLFETSNWLLISRGLSKRLFKLGLTIAPLIVGSFVIGLPFGIKGVALSYSIVVLLMLPWIMKFSFQGTRLTLQRLGRAILCPVLLSLAGILFAVVAARVMNPTGSLSQLLVAALGFAVALLASALLPRVREELLYLKTLLRELRSPAQTA